MSLSQEHALLRRPGVDGDDVVLALRFGIQCARCHGTPDRIVRFSGKLELCVPCVRILCYTAQEAR